MAWPLCADDACVCSLLSVQLHPNPNLKNPDPLVDLNILVGATAQKHAVRGRRSVVSA